MPAGTVLFRKEIRGNFNLYFDFSTFSNKNTHKTEIIQFKKWTEDTNRYFSKENI